MAGSIVCPRCGARDSFRKGYLPDTCICGVCESQLGYQEIPGCGPDCGPLEAAPSIEDEKTTGGEESQDGAKD
jgi:hypothetical protein